jgi:hypothetical protein
LRKTEDGAGIEKLKGDFELESRGAIEVKGKGEIETWLLHGQLKSVEASA